MTDPKSVETSGTAADKTEKHEAEKPSEMEVTSESADRSGSYDLVGSVTENSLRTTGSYDMVGMSQSRSQELGASQEADWEKLDNQDWEKLAEEEKENRSDSNRSQNSLRKTKKERRSGRRMN